MSTNLSNEELRKQLSRKLTQMKVKAIADKMNNDPNIPEHLKPGYEGEEEIYHPNPIINKLMKGEEIDED